MRVTTHVAVVERRRCGRAAAVVLGVNPDERARDRSVQLTASELRGSGISRRDPRRWRTGPGWNGGRGGPWRFEGSLRRADAGLWSRAHPSNRKVA